MKMMKPPRLQKLAMADARAATKQREAKSNMPEISIPFIRFVMLAVPSVQVQQLLSPAMLVLVFVMVIDGFVLGRKVNRMVDEKFPDNTETGWKLGFYAASRASQLRRMRAPRPQVERGASVG